MFCCCCWWKESFPFRRAMGALEAKTSKKTSRWPRVKVSRAPQRRSLFWKTRAGWENVDVDGDDAMEMLLLEEDGGGGAAEGVLDKKR